MIFSIPSFTKGDVCPHDGRWYLSSWREKANFPPEKILQQNKEHKKRMPPNEGGIIRQWQRCLAVLYHCLNDGKYLFSVVFWKVSQLVIQQRTLHFIPCFENIV